MSATITLAHVPNSLPVIQLTLTTPEASSTSYPTTLDSALATINGLGITEIEYEELVDTRLIHDTLAA